MAIAILARQFEVSTEEQAERIATLFRRYDRLGRRHHREASWHARYTDDRTCLGQLRAKLWFARMDVTYQLRKQVRLALITTLKQSKVPGRRLRPE